MNPIFLIVGFPAAGKSSTSKALMAQFSKGLHIPVDDFRNMVVSGLLLPGPDWSQGLVEQISLARESAIQMALNYQRAGFAVALDDFVDPHRLKEYEGFREQTKVHKLILMPSQTQAHRRNLKRASQGGAGNDQGREYIDEGIRIGYQTFGHLISQLEAEGWWALDNSGLSLEQTVQTILKHFGYK